MVEKEPPAAVACMEHWLLTQAAQKEMGKHTSVPGESSETLEMLGGTFRNK